MNTPPPSGQRSASRPPTTKRSQPSQPSQPAPARAAPSHPYDSLLYISFSDRGEERILKEPIGEGRRTWSAVCERLKDVWGPKPWQFHYLDGNKRRIDVIDELSWQLCCHDLGRTAEASRVLHAVQRGTLKRAHPSGVGPPVVLRDASGAAARQSSLSSPGGSSTASSAANNSTRQASGVAKRPPELFIYIDDEDDMKEEEPLARTTKRVHRESLSAQMQGEARDKWQADVEKHGFTKAWENLPLEGKKKFFKARGAARTIFGNPAYLLNPYEVACPLCNRVLRMSHPSNPSFSTVFSHMHTHRNAELIRAREMMEKRKELFMLNRPVNAKSAPLPDCLSSAPVPGTGKCLDVRYVAEGADD